MKIRVVANAKGKIMATVPFESIGTGLGAPRLGGVTAGAGQRVHEVEVGDDVLRMDRRKLHAEYRVKAGPQPQLVREAPASGAKSRGKRKR